MSLKSIKSKKNSLGRIRKNSALSLQLQKLYSQPLPSTRTGALYNAFSYPTKISPEAIALFIGVHTNPGDVVLDTFAGSGTTGLAALLCDNPTPELIKIASDLKLKPVWGPRKAILYELGVLGSFVSGTMCNPPNPEAFDKAASSLIDDVARATEWMYAAKDPNGKVGQIRHVIWSDVLICPKCNSESLYCDVAVKRYPLQFSEYFSCPSCKYKESLNKIKHATELKLDPVTKKKQASKKREIAFVYGKTGGKNWSRRATTEDIELQHKIEKVKIPTYVPIKEIVWGDLQRNGYHQGISHIHNFYTRRNLLVLAMLWDKINEYPRAIQNSLKFLLLSYNATHATLMTRVVAKKGQNDFVITGAQSGILYISSLPVEKNIIFGLRRKLKTIKAAFATVYGSRSEVEVVNRSSANLKLKSKSVDYVFTDPPFGDYIPYAELNQINEAWLGKATHRDHEIIVSHSQGKSVSTYGAMIADVFTEISRVLKDGANATLVFHSAKAEVWRAIADAYKQAGLNVLTSSVLDKVQASFKQVVSETSVKGDPLLLLAKGIKGDNDIKLHTQLVLNEILLKAANEEVNSKERTAERLYSRYVSLCLEMGVHVSMNAESFYKSVREIKGIR
jgi:DNA modification methylase